MSKKTIELQVMTSINMYDLVSCVCSLSINALYVIH